MFLPLIFSFYEQYIQSFVAAFDKVISFCLLIYFSNTFNLHLFTLFADFGSFVERELVVSYCMPFSLARLCTKLLLATDHRRHLRLKGREFSSAEGASKLKGSMDMFPRETFLMWGRRCAYLVKSGNKSLEYKNNSNEIILIGFFLKVKGHFQHTHTHTPILAPPLQKI